MKLCFDYEGFDVDVEYFTITDDDGFTARTIDKISVDGIEYDVQFLVEFAAEFMSDIKDMVDDACARSGDVFEVIDFSE
jgi:hypothetical protein